MYARKNEHSRVRINFFLRTRFFRYHFFYLFSLLKRSSPLFLYYSLLYLFFIFPFSPLLLYSFLNTFISLFYLILFFLYRHRFLILWSRALICHTKEFGEYTFGNCATCKNKNKNKRKKQKIMEIK